MSFVVKPLLPRLVPAVYVSGLNFRSHAVEVGLEKSIGKYPIFAMKNPSSVVFASSLSDSAKPSSSLSVCAEVEIRVPKFIQDPPEVDYEGELAVVIGKRCKNVPRDKVIDVVEGFTCANDVTARRWQGKKGGGQWCFCKSFDTFCPLGADMMTLTSSAKTDALDEVKEWTLSTSLNGTVVQKAELSDMIFDVPTLVSFLSQGTILEAGTVILCGTPAGVGYCRKRKPEDQVATGASSSSSSSPLPFITTVVPGSEQQQDNTLNPYYLKHGDCVDISLQPLQRSLSCRVVYE